MKPWASYLVVFLGAGFGGALRHAVNIIALRTMRPDLPIGTFAVNVIGSFAAGLLSGYLAPQAKGAAGLRLFALTGVLGGFTTFSAYSLEVSRLIERGAVGSGFAYATASIIFSIAAAFAGFALGRS